MLVKASSQRQSYGAAVTGAVFADVAADSQYASAIRTASSNEWMSGFLGGNFKPEEGVTLRDAAKGPGPVRLYQRGLFRKSQREPDGRIFRPVSGLRDLQEPG